MAVGNLMDADSPYVHSSIYHIMGSVKDFFSNSENSLMEKELQKTIAIFEDWIAQLQAYEQEIYNFCGVSDFQSLNAKLFGSGQEDKISAAAKAVVLESSTMLQLVPMISKRQARAIFNTLGKDIKITDYLDLKESDFTLTETRNALWEALRNLFSGEGEVIVKADALEKIVGGENFKRKVNKDLVDWVGKARITATSKGSKMRQLATSILKAKIGDFQIPYANFQRVFIEKFKERIIRERIALPANKTLEQLAEDTCRKLYDYLFEGKVLTDIANIVGERGEGLLGFSIDNASLESVDLKIEVMPTGKENEEKIASVLSKEMGVAADKIKMTDYTLDGSGQSSQSKSDMIIKIISSSGEKIFRIQSKDFLIQRLEKANNGDSVYQTVKMMDNNISSILHLLSEKTIIDNESIATLSYFIANMIWFNRYGSYDNGTPTKRNRGEGSGGGIGGMQEAINRIVSQGIQAFIGITVEESFEDKPLQVNTFASNVFYFLGARTLFPVSEVLKAAVRQMEGFSQSLASTRFVIDTGGSISFNPEGAKAFWDKKRENVSGGSFGALTYTDEGLLGVGKAQGAAIIGSASGHINFNFDIGKILSISSYVF